MTRSSLFASCWPNLCVSQHAAGIELTVTLISTFLHVYKPVHRDNCSSVLVRYFTCRNPTSAEIHTPYRELFFPLTSMFPLLSLINHVALIFATHLSLYSSLLPAFLNCEFFPIICLVQNQSALCPVPDSGHNHSISMQFKSRFCKIGRHDSPGTYRPSLPSFLPFCLCGTSIFVFSTHSTPESSSSGPWSKASAISSSSFKCRSSCKDPIFIYPRFRCAPKGLSLPSLEETPWAPNAIPEDSSHWSSFLDII